MLSIVLIWSYVLVTTYIIGYGAVNLILVLPCMKHMRGERPVPYRVRFRETYLMAGTMVVTAAAEVFSIFRPVDSTVIIVLTLVCLAIALYNRRSVTSGARHIIRVFRSTHSWPVYLALFFIMAFATSHGIMHYDTGLYHAQSIHWLESFGLVKGLGNLHVRLAYNSAAFPLSALYSFSFLGIRSFHVMAGYMALLLAWQCADLARIRRRGHLVLSDFSRLLSAYYLFGIFDEIVSPASDFFLGVLVLYIITNWLDLLVIREHSFVPYALLSVAAVFTVSVKLSAAILVLLALKPLVMLIANKTIKALQAALVFLAAGLLLICPFFIRNVLISGYLIYPFPALDFFSVDWKIPREIAAYDAKEIAVYGRGYTDVSLYDLPIYKWIGSWFQNMPRTDRIMLLADGLAILLFLIYAGFFLKRLVEEKRHPGLQVNRRKLRKKKRGNVLKLSSYRVLGVIDYLHLQSVLFGMLIFWFLSAPLIRYGWVFVWTPAVIFAGRFLIDGLERLSAEAQRRAYYGMRFIILLFFLYKSAMLLRDAVGYDVRSFLVLQQDYQSFETRKVEVDGQDFYIPVTGDQAGYTPFPSAPSMPQIRLRGETIRDGFVHR